ncbi:LINE-1 retrotransposable element ORF2 protein [Linum grandiflorum]
MFHELLLILQNINLPLIVFGDFNVVSDSFEKEGGLPIRPVSVSQFRAFISDLGLYDPGFSGPTHTWSNRARDRTRLIHCRLDRFLVSHTLMTTYPNLRVSHLTDLGSDHRIIYLTLQPTHSISMKRPFRFDNRQLSNTELSHLVHHIWATPFSGSKLFILHSKFKALRHALHAWQRSGISNSARKIKSIKDTISLLRDQHPTPWSQIIQLKTELSQACTEESHYWRQKCQNNWLHSGDRNTAFFHRATITRQHFNLLGPITDSAGLIHDSEESKLYHAMGYFQDLFTSQSHPHDNSNLSSLDFDVGVPRVTNPMNEMLIRPFSDRDIRKAVFSIGTSKSPGSDGFTAGFYQHFWPLIGPDICAGIRAFFHSSRMLRSINHTWLSLIPKVSSATSMTQVRPIGLCQMLYKIISKLLAARLATILPSIISPTQNGFVPHRAISDNVIVAHEVMHYLKRKKTGKKYFMALKLDMEKAYDRIEWCYLFSLLIKLGFSPTWVTWIKECITTTSFSVLLNGNSSPTFTPSRGLRQGDPLSPLLFALCTECLISLIQEAIAVKQFTGIRLNRHCPVLSHILFADDTFLFLQASTSECSSLLQLLDRYQALSGQRVNLTKSDIYFSSNTPSTLKGSLSRLLQVPNLDICSRYLGLPTQISRSRASTFRYIEDRVADVLQGWKAKNLSPAGMEVLIKSIASAIPCYAMSMFKFPKGLCTRLNKMIARFWWGASASRRRMHWKSWHYLTKPKLMGGLNFRDFEQINHSLLASLCWRLYHSPSSIAFQVLKGRYFPSGTILTASKGSAPSWCWTGILYGRDLLLQGGRWLVGTGTTIPSMEAPWLPSSDSSIPIPRPLTLPIPAKVSDFISHDGVWNSELLSTFFCPSSVTSILSIPLPQTWVPDRFVWSPSRTGEYTAASGYHFARMSLVSSRVLKNGPTIHDSR